MSVPCVVFILSQRSRLEHQIGTDPHQGQRALRPALRDEGVHIRPHQQPRGQEPSRGQRDKPGSGPPPPPHRDRESRDQVWRESLSYQFMFIHDITHQVIISVWFPPPFNVPSPNLNRICHLRSFIVSYFVTMVTHIWIWIELLNYTCNSLNFDKEIFFSIGRLFAGISPVITDQSQATWRGMAVLSLLGTKGLCLALIFAPQTFQ